MPELNQLLSALLLVALVLYPEIGQFCRASAVVPARHHSYYWNSYGNCGGGDRKMVHSLTPEHLAVGHGVITNRLN